MITYLYMNTYGWMSGWISLEIFFFMDFCGICLIRKRQRRTQIKIPDLPRHPMIIGNQSMSL